jgi:CHASE3 domain sensor protein
MARSPLPPRPGAGGIFVGAAFGLAAVVVLFGGAFGAYLSAAGWVDHTLQVRQVVAEWMAAARDAESDGRDYAATDQPIFRERYEAALARERATEGHVIHLLADNPAQARNVDATDREARAAMDDLRDVVALAVAGHRDQALARFGSSERKDRMERFRTDAHGIRSEEERLLLERRASAKRRGGIALVGAIGLALSSCGLLALAWRREGMHRRFVANLATEAQERLAALSGLAAALSDARTRPQVAGVIVDHGMRAVGADTCTLYELDEAGELLELIGHRGVAHDVLNQVRHITETAGAPATFAAMRAGQATWAESEADYAHLHPALATMKTEGRRVKAFWSVPLVAEGRTLGLLGVGFYAPRRFSEDEKGFVETLTRHCAQAFLRALRLERIDEARQWFATTLRSIGDAVIATDAEGRVAFHEPCGGER